MSPAGEQAYWELKEENDRIRERIAELEKATETLDFIRDREGIIRHYGVELYDFGLALHRSIDIEDEEGGNVLYILQHRFGWKVEKIETS